MSSCSKLPQEVLHYIVQHVNSNPKTPKTKDLKAMQLVCKNWREPAREALYQHVNLTKNARSFATTITQSPRIGSLVKSVHFLEGFDSYDNYTMREIGSNKKHLQEIFQAIVGYCVNVKHIHCFLLRTTHNMIEFLLSEHNNIKGLENLETEHGWNSADPVNYKEVALRYNSTMKHLSLTYKYSDCDRRQIIEYRELESRLHLFPALLQLDISTHLFKDVDKIDQMLDSCAPSLSGLFVKEWWSANDIVVLPQIKPNTSITKLRMDIACTTPEAMHYLAIKLKGLKEMYVKFKTSLASAEAIEEWWRHLNSISLGLTTYTIGIGPPRLESGVGQLNRCLDIVQKTAPAACSRHFELKYCCQERPVSTVVSILMSRTPNSYHLTISQRSATGFHLPDLARSVQRLYLPDSIHLKFEPFDEVYEYLCRDNESDDGLWDDDNYIDFDTEFLPPRDIKRVFRRLQIGKNRAWAFFTSFLAYKDLLKNQGICVERMVAFKRKHRANHPVFSKTSNVTFKSCILEHHILPTVSQFSPAIDRLVFDTTCILMDERYNLKLHLPETKIHTLKFVIRPMVEALEQFSGDCDYDLCKLENLELLDAVSSTGQYTLKIETMSKKYISKRKDGKVIQDNCNDVSTGTRDNFLIWIKCKELDQFLVTTDRSSEDFELVK